MDGRLISAPKPGVFAQPLTQADADRLAAVAAARPACGLALCGILSKRGDGWRAEDVRARIYTSQKKFTEAIAVWESLLKAGEGPADACALAAAETRGFMLGDHAHAAALYAEWLTRHPGSPLREKAEYQRAGALWMANDFAAAVSAFESFLAAHPSGHYAEEARRTLGRARSDLENRRRAETRAAAGKTADGPLADDLALAERKLRGGLPAEAVKVFNHFRGKHAHPQWGRAWYGYGLCRRALGEPEKALDAWDEVLRQAALFTNTLCAAECRKRLGGRRPAARGRPLRRSAGRRGKGGPLFPRDPPEPSGRRPRRDGRPVSGDAGLVDGRVAGGRAPAPRLSGKISGEPVPGGVPDAAAAGHRGAQGGDRKMTAKRSMMTDTRFFAILAAMTQDDFGLVSGWMTLECWPTDGVRFLKEDGATALWHGASVSYSETPLMLYVDPVPEKAGPFTVTLKGDMDDAFNRPTDYLTGRAVLLDLDVDADNNGAINDADDPLEETPGGILATGTVKQVALKLAPAGLTGTLKLLAVSGGSHIRLWRDAGKTSPVTLPAEWELSGGYTFPTALYVEGIDASAAVRDVHLCLRYTAAGDQYVDDNIRLTIIKVELTATDLDGAVTDATEETTGAYVHWNLDNDDASDNAVGAPKRSGANYRQTGAAKVADEDDLKSLAMSFQPYISQGSVLLNIANAKAKIWKDAEKGNANLVLAGPGDKTWSLADAGQMADFVSLCSSLWVEGVDNGTCDIKLSYKDASGTAICSDKVKYTFIAADCGRQPKTDPPNERNGAKSTFPNLVHCEWSITAEATPIYNCIAWSAGISDRWFEQVILIGGVSVADHWLGGVHYVGIDAKYGNSNGVFEVQADLDAFYAAEASVTPIASGPGDASVIYYDGYHGAKKKGCTCGSGKWIMFESKCGQWLRLEHVYDQLDGSTCGYGARTRYYK